MGLGSAPVGVASEVYPISVRDVAGWTELWDEKASGDAVRCWPHTRSRLWLTHGAGVGRWNIEMNLFSKDIVFKKFK